MRFSLEQQDFLKGLSIVQKAINSQNTLPILANILLKAEGQKLTLSATNLEISIQASIACNIKNEGSITIPSRIINSWVGFCKPGEIEVNLGENNTISLKTADAKTKIKGVSADDFPVLPIVENENEFLINPKEFKEAINEVSFSCASSGIRPVLSGVLLLGKGDLIQLVATDSYRLSERKINLDKKLEKDIYSIIPSRTMVETERILSMFKKDDEKIKIITSQNQILFNIGNTKIISRLIEGKFPEHTQIIPKVINSTIEINKSEFILAVKRIGIFAKENNNNINLSFGKDNMSITTDVTDIGSEEANIPISLKGSVNQTALNGQFLLDVLSIIPDDEIYIKVSEKLSPVIIHGKNQKNFVHIIMPLKL